MAAKKPNGDYTNIEATAGGNLKVAIEEFDASLPSGTNNIGDVDVVSSVLPTGAATAANQQTDALTDTELRATPVPVSGTVTANLSATDNAVLDQIELNQDSQTSILTTIDTDTGNIASGTSSIDSKITACNTGAVTISAALPAGTNAIGKLAANSGVDIGDVDVTSLPAIKEDGLIKSTITDTTVDTSADLIFDASADTDAVELTISNPYTVALYVGEDASVTTSDFMYYIPPLQTIVIKHAGNTGTTEDLYGIRASGSGLCKVYSRKYK